MLLFLADIVIGIAKEKTVTAAPESVFDSTYKERTKGIGNIGNNQADGTRLASRKPSRQAARLEFHFLDDGLHAQTRRVSHTFRFPVEHPGHGGLGDARLFRNVRYCGRRHSL